jgi:hypothetical protein
MYTGMPELRVPCPIAERARTIKNAGEQKNGAQGRNRTTDTAIFSRMLYQLSYLGMSRGRLGTGEPAGYSGAEGPCLPRYAFVSRGAAARNRRRSAPGVARRANTGCLSGPLVNPLGKLA